MTVLLDIPLELRTIKTLCSKKEKLRALMFSRLTVEHFHYPPAKRAFIRYKEIIKKTGDVPTWTELLADPKLESNFRKILRNFKKPPLLDLSKVERAQALLTEYRNIRSVFFTVEEVYKEFGDDKKSVIIEDIISKLGDTVAGTRQLGSEDEFFEEGSKASFRLLEGLLVHRDKALIPTGFKSFDDINGGLMRGTVFLMGACTSSGKSAVSQKMARNMAYAGADVRMVPLEMDKEEMMQRAMSNTAGIDLTNIIQPKKLDNVQKNQIRAAWKKHSDKLRRSGGRLRYFVPKRDIGIEELFITLKPYQHDVIIIDYIGLLEGMSDEDQWRKLGDAVRIAKIFAKSNNCVVVILAQVSEEMKVRYSRTMNEHADNVWIWNYNEESQQTHLLNILQTKARNQKKFNFTLVEDFATMDVRDPDKSEQKRFKQGGGHGSGKHETSDKNNRNKAERRWHSSKEDIDLNEFYDDEEEQAPKKKRR